MSYLKLVSLVFLMASALTACYSPKTICTQEARLCPDGSYVSRIGPNCEFAACPAAHSRNDRRTIHPAADYSGGEGSSGGNSGIHSNQPSPPNQPEPRACSMEAKLCPDGSYVSRTGPNCEFAPCPDDSSNSTPPHACPMDTKRCPDGSYVIRIGPNCEFAACPR